MQFSRTTQENLFIHSNSFFGYNVTDMHASILTPTKKKCKMEYVEMGEGCSWIKNGKGRNIKIMKKKLIIEGAKLYFKIMNQNAIFHNLTGWNNCPPLPSGGSALWEWALKPLSIF